MPRSPDEYLNVSRCSRTIRLITPGISGGKSRLAGSEFDTINGEASPQPSDFLLLNEPKRSCSIEERLHRNTPFRFESGELRLIESTHTQSNRDLSFWHQKRASEIVGFLLHSRTWKFVHNEMPKLMRELKRAGQTASHFAVGTAKSVTDLPIGRELLPTLQLARSDRGAGQMAMHRKT